MMASNLEVRIHNVLEANHIKFKEEYTFPDLKTKSGIPLRFDFAVFLNGKLAFLIEAQGRQHYQSVSAFGGNKAFKKQQYNDARKRSYCKQKGIKLVTIPYQDESKITLDYIMSKGGYKRV